MFKALFNNIKTTIVFILAKDYSYSYIFNQIVLNVFTPNYEIDNINLGPKERAFWSNVPDN